jgi:multidrug efflux pump subunit AcrA (membrane-fusion protein)
MLSGGNDDFMQVLQKVAPAGSHVTRGQIVAEFDQQFQLLRLDDYKSTVEQADRTLRSLDSTLEVQRKSYDQNIQQAKGAVEKAKLDIKTTPVRSAIEAEQLQLALEEAQANLKQLQSQIPFQETSLKSQRRISEIDAEQSRVELKRAERNVSLMRITASMDGMIAMENMMRGSEFSQVQQGDQLFPGQLFARIVDPSSFLVSATINQADVEYVRVGSKATLHFDAYPEMTLPAHVTSIAAITKPGGARASYVKEIPLYLKIDKLDPRVIPDLTVSADVVIQTNENQLLAPIESIFRDGPTGKPYVYVKTGETFEKRTIELGDRNNIKTIVASGLKAGDVIALDAPRKPEGQATASASLQTGQMPQPANSSRPWVLALAVPVLGLRGRMLRAYRRLNNRWERV